MYDDFDDGYYKPVKTFEACDNSYGEYRSKGDKFKILSIKECLYMIRQYLSDIINNHKDE